MHRCFHLLKSPLLTLGLLLGAAVASAGSDSLPAESLPVPDSPLGAVHRLILAYEQRLLDPYAALLSADFRFLFADSESRAAYPNGFTREDEIASAQHLFNGFTDRAGVRRPAAQSIEVISDSFWVAPEPARPDSAAWYRVVVAENVRLRVTLEGGDGFATSPMRHEFHVARADAAVCLRGQPADLDHWFVRLWVENPRPDLVVRAPRPQEQAPAPVAAIAPGRMAFVRAPNPARSPVWLAIALAEHGNAKLELFDAQGRRVANHDLGERGPGDYEVPAVNGPALAPGLYWIRLSQGHRTITTRIVVLR